ncbi:MAG TPA: type IV toxin-antitoxin system AbiEi family antitoxin domain-containing protein [Steroidobacteraceae bacterium]|nr:type IV toxin-antitoxin system AbiEi family antitoxin domain-containing protein [Steroidobacteraceae bacterium]
MKQTRDLDSAIRKFQRHGGTLRTSQARALGIHPAAIYELRDSGRLTELGRGLYRVADAKELENPDLAVVGVRVPNAVVCLISALSYHGITTQIPAAIHLAVPRGTYHRIKLDPLPVQVYRYDAKTFSAGIEKHDVGGVSVRVYGVARTVADMFKFRNKLGLDIAIEALRLARERKHLQNRELLHFARLLRVERPMEPYLQAMG